MSAFTPAGSGGAPSTTTIVGATNPTIAHVTMPVSGTEYSYTVPTGAKQFLVKLQSLAVLQLAYVSGQSGTTYITVPRGCFYAESDLTLTAPVTLYFQANTATQVLEVVFWT